ncbi:MAG: PAS domain S-box protein [Pseudomonadota bacterium]
MASDDHLHAALSAIRAEDQLALLAGVIGGSSASISIADSSDPALPLVYVNEAFEILSGYTRSDVLGQNCRFLSAERPDSAERSRLREAIADRRPGVFELRNKRKDGVIFWNRLSLYPVSLPGGRSYLVATQEDISAEREAQIDRDSARGQLLSALAGTREGFLLLDKYGVVEVANARFREFYESAPDQWTRGRHFTASWSDYLVGLQEPPKTAARKAEQRFEQIASGQKDREEQLPDGRVVQVNDTVIPYTGYVTVVTDITTHKATERRLAERMVAIDAAQDGMAIADGAGRFVYLNPSHVTMFGYDTPMDLIGQSWEKLYRPEQIAYLQKHAMPVLMESGRWRGDIAGIRKDGSEIMQDVALTRLDGVGLICVTRDISDRVRGENERARLREQLAQAQRQEAIGHLAAGIAHDFNNVLAVVSGSARLIAEDASEALAPHVQRIIAAGDQAQQLVARILDFGARAPERAVQDMRKPFLDAITLVKSGLPMNIKPVIYQPDTPVTGELDPTDLMQVILNLSLNARDAMPGGGRLMFTLDQAPDTLHRQTPTLGHVRQDVEYARLTIADTGNGIEPERMGSIFEPYHSTKGEDGTGLGLAVVSSIVTSIGGALFVISTPGDGTQFDVLWPLTMARKPERPDPLTHAPSADLSGRRVILVDDDAAVAEIMAEEIERRGAEVAVCTDARDALDAVSEDPDFWDVIITDFDMPVMSGAELARKINVLSPGKAMILCTALADWRGRNETAAELFSSVLQKPLKDGALAIAVSECIDG